MKVLNGPHRPWPVPGHRPAMAMVWHDLCFLHWPVRAESVRARLPAPIAPFLDIFDGWAWIAVVPFHMSGVRGWGLPGLPGLSAFPELNVRTYVTMDGRPGVWFFSLDATSRIAVRVARAMFSLPYMDARITCRDEHGQIVYHSLRTHRGEPPAEFAASYAPTGQVFAAQPGSIEHFLTERYALYSLTRRGVVLRGDIDHPPWPLQPARCLIQRITMAQAAGIQPDDRAPLAHFAKKLEVPAWLPVPVRPPLGQPAQQTMR